MNLSVIIPSFNAEHIIEKSLSAIFNQSLAPTEYEVLVINDGSNDSTHQTLQELQNTYTFQYICFSQNQGVAKARNEGSKQAKGQILVFIQDDIIVEHDFLKQHLRVHQQFPEEKTVVVGFTHWHPDLRKTSLLEYLDKGQQFDFDRFLNAHQSKKIVPADHLLFYTSNLSLHKSFLLAQGGFDENFFVPGVTAYEDTELAWRLKKAGMAIYFNPHAKAGHFHQRDLRSMINRRYAEGMMTHRLYQKHPDFSWSGESQSFWYNLSRLKLGALFDRLRLPIVFFTSIIFNPLIVWPLEKLALAVQDTWNIPLLYKIVLGYHYNRGFWKGLFMR
jgi:glycosyltransferase involved in cell wall biosynthesis